MINDILDNKALLGPGLWCNPLKVVKVIVKDFDEFYMNTVGMIQVNRLENLNYKGLTFLLIHKSMRKAMLYKSTTSA